jgi:hypothetical protein
VGVSTRRKFELSPAEQVDVKVKDSLPAVGVRVYHDAVTVFRDPAGPCYLGRGE